MTEDTEDVCVHCLHAQDEHGPAGCEHVTYATGLIRSNRRHGEHLHLLRASGPL